ncbi:hypothetical protein E1A91_A05G421100v1 [Gossypium mustelinum]|uniref:Secreted protein n=1 Tax=Gossypium mustelinum TaxID=34275 RepID=A0A5D2ZJB7_GOSMU|nr:hypothetical protein E1A91_A05G421100v1 [Gossypium mustelinum]
MHEFVALLLCVLGYLLFPSNCSIIFWIKCSSRTSGGQPKLLPVTVEYQKKASETDLFKVVTQAKTLVKHWSAIQH